MKAVNFQLKDPATRISADIIGGLAHLVVAEASAPKAEACETPLMNGFRRCMALVQRPHCIVKAFKSSSGYAERCLG